MHWAFVLLVLTSNFAYILSSHQLILTNSSSCEGTCLLRNDILYLYKDRSATIKCSTPKWFKPETSVISWTKKRVNGIEEKLAYKQDNEQIVQNVEPHGTVYTCYIKDPKEQEKFDNATVTVYRADDQIKREASFDGVTIDFEPTIIKFNESNLLVLQCEKKGIEKFDWYFNDKKVDKNEKGISSNDTALTIHSMQPSNGGVYACYTNENKTHGTFFNVVGEPKFAVKHEETSENKMEDDFVIIPPEGTAAVLGNANIRSYTWVFRKEEDKDSPNETITDNDAISEEFKKNHDDLAKRMTFYKVGDVINGKLRIDNLKKEDRAYYIIQVANSTGNVTYTTLVRVKGKLDALWPFLGIVAEVIILVAIIFIYERRRAKRDAESEDTPDQKQPLKSNNDNLRQRNNKT